MVSAAVVSACLVALGCLDAAGPGGAHRASLAVYPVFEGYGPLDGTPSDVDSFRITVSNPPFPDTVIVRVLTASQDTIQVNVPVLVGSGLDTVTIGFQGYNSTTGLLLYSGTQQVELLTGIPGPQQPIQANYVGPGRRIKVLVISPAEAALRPGETQLFSYTGFDSSDVEMPDDSVPAHFVSTNTHVATVSAAGLVTAVADGIAGIIVASVARNSIRDTARVTVSSAPPPLISLSQSAITFNDTAATANPAPQTVTVDNSGGGTLSGLAVGTITYGPGATGWLTASLNTTTAPATLTLSASNTGLTAGTYTATVPVTASGVSNSPQSASVTYILAPPLLVSIAAAPGFAVLQPTNTVTLTTTGKDGLGAPAPVTGLSYTSRSPTVATVNATTGVVTGVAGGTAVIVASATGASGAVLDSMTVAVAATGSPVASAIADGRAFQAARVGDTVRVLVAVDLQGVSPEKLGSYNAQLNWSTTALRYVRTDPVTGGFVAATLNETATGTGQLRFGAANAAGSAGPSVGLATVVFVGNAAGTSTLTLALTDLSASGTFMQLLTQALIYSGTVRIQ